MLLTETQELETLIAENPEAAAAAAGVFAVGMATIVVSTIIWYVLVIIGDWKIFEKAGKPGWHSLIPFLNMYDEYDLCWNGSMGVVYMVCLFITAFLSTGEELSGIKAVICFVTAIVTLVLRIIQSNKLAKAFGHGIGFTICLILFERISRVVLGLGNSQYQGPQ